MKAFSKYVSLLIISLLFSLSTLGQTAPISFHYEQYDMDFGIISGKELSQELLEFSQFYFLKKTKAGTSFFPPESYLKVSKHISAKADAPWIRLRFDDVNLGNNSYLVITSDHNQDKQYFNHYSINEWKQQSAFLQGNSVKLELMIAPGDNDIRLRLTELSVGEFYGNQPPPDFLCGYDSRVSSSYEYVDGRIMPIGCSGWMTSAGFYITAGHCLDVTSYDLQVIQFHVPESLCDGTPVPCAIEDQYPIVFSSRVYQNADSGDDWGIFNVGSNSNTGLTPLEAERSYYHLSKNLIPANILLRGFGTDHTPNGCNGYYNSNSQTLQYDVGDNLGEYFNGSYDVYFEYLCDTQNGSSGSVLQSNGVSGVTRHAIGVHTHGGCNPPNTGNKGTSFEADDTEAAMNSYWQSNCEYVDVGHHLSSTVGSAVLPHYSIQNALNEADAGHGPGVSSLELILVAGSNNGDGGIYDESVSYSGASNGVVIRRSVGAVVIGPNANKNGTENKGLSPLESVSENDAIIFNEFLPGQTKAFEK